MTYLSRFFWIKCALFELGFFSALLVLIVLLVLRPASPVVATVAIAPVVSDVANLVAAAVPKICTVLVAVAVLPFGNGVVAAVGLFCSVAAATVVTFCKMVVAAAVVLLCNVLLKVAVVVLVPWVSFVVVVVVVVVPAEEFADVVCNGGGKVGVSVWGKTQLPRLFWNTSWSWEVERNNSYSHLGGGVRGCCFCHVTSFQTYPGCNFWFILRRARHFDSDIY